MKDKRPFSKLYHDLNNSPAWKQLSKYGQIAYINIIFAYRGKQPFTCPRNKLFIKVSPVKHSEGVAELEKAGFITIERTLKKANRYAFSKSFLRLRS